MATSDSSTVICARCNRELTCGTGELFEIRIQAVADPFPPILELASADDIRRDFAQTVEALSQLSARDALESVAARRIFYLCVPCYKKWIESPAGDGIE